MLPGFLKEPFPNMEKHVKDGCTAQVKKAVESKCVSFGCNMVTQQTTKKF